MSKEIYVPILAEIASHFEGARVNGHNATCPCCGADSLRIFSNPYIPAAVQIKCAAGCSRNAVLGRVGLAASALYPQGSAKNADATASKAVSLV